MREDPVVLMHMVPLMEGNSEIETSSQMLVFCFFFVLCLVQPALKVFFCSFSSVGTNLKV